MAAPQHLEVWHEGEIEKKQSLRQESKTTARKNQVSELSGKLREEGISPVDASERLNRGRIDYPRASADVGDW